jgi:hypothetical protein
VNKITIQYEIDSCGDLVVFSISYLFLIITVLLFNVYLDVYGSIMKRENIREYILLDIENYENNLSTRLN